MKKIELDNESFFKNEYKTDFTFLHHTGNVWGIGCSAFNKKAIQKVNLLKQRPLDKTFIVLIDSCESLKKLDIKISDKNKRILKQFYPGNLTAIMNCSHPKLQHLAIDGKVAFRIPTSYLLRKSIKKIGTPIISTSINISNQPPENDYNLILKKFDNWFDFELVTEVPSEQNNEVSTIVDFSEDTPKLIRNGSIDFEEIKLAADKPQILFVCTGNTCRSPLAELYCSSVSTKFRFQSAGTNVSDEKISKNSKQILNDMQIKTDSFIPQKMNDDLLQDSQIILAMNINHKNKLVEKFPSSKHKIFTFAEFVNEKKDIEDPFGEDINIYQNTFTQIKNYCDILLENYHKLINKLEG